MAQDTALTPYYWDAESNTMQPFTGNYKAANGFINIAVERTEDAADAVRMLMQLSEASTSPNTQFVCIFPKNVEFPSDYYNSYETEKWANHSISMDHAPQEATDGLTGLRQWFEANEVRRAERRESRTKLARRFDTNPVLLAAKDFPSHRWGALQTVPEKPADDVAAAPAASGLTSAQHKGELTPPPSPNKGEGRG